MFNASFHLQGSVKQTKILQLIRDRELRRREHEARAEPEETAETLRFADGLELPVAPWTPSVLHAFEPEDG